MSRGQRIYQDIDDKLSGRVKLEDSSYVNWADRLRYNQTALNQRVVEENW